MKKYISLLFAMLMFCFPLLIGENINAYGSKNSESKIVYITDESIRETRFNDGIIKKEVISCNSYDYGVGIPNNTYKYLLVRVTVTYSDENDKCLASAYFESTFRYNTKLGLSKCLSTSHRQSVNSDKYSFEIFGRTKNLSLDTGECFGKIALFTSGSESDVCKYIFSCDKNGNIFKFTV